MARRKITDTQEDLPDLTENQMKFCEGVLAGKTQSDAYRAAYDCQNMAPESIWVAASRLRHDAKVALWLDAARSDRLESHECTFDGHLKELERLKSIAIRSGNVGAAVQAEQLRGKAAGLYVDKHEDVTQYDPVRTLEDIARQSPELAHSLAKQHNIDWKPKETVH